MLALVSILTLVGRSKEAFELITFPMRDRIKVMFAVTSSLPWRRFLPLGVSSALTSRLGELLVFNTKVLSLTKRMLERALFTNFQAAGPSAWPAATAWVPEESREGGPAVVSTAG